MPSAAVVARSKRFTRSSEMPNLENFAPGSPTKDALQGTATTKGNLTRLAPSMPLCSGTRRTFDKVERPQLSVRTLLHLRGVEGDDDGVPRHVHASCPLPEQQQPRHHPRLRRVADAPPHPSAPRLRRALVAVRPARHVDEAVRLQPVGSAGVPRRGAVDGAGSVREAGGVELRAREPRDGRVHAVLREGVPQGRQSAAQRVKPGGARHPGYFSTSGLLWIHMCRAMPCDM